MEKASFSSDILNAAREQKTGKVGSFANHIQRECHFLSLQWGGHDDIFRGEGHTVSEWYFTGRTRPVLGTGITAVRALDWILNDVLKPGERELVPEWHPGIIEDIIIEKNQKEEAQRSHAKTAASVAETEDDGGEEDE